MTSAVATQVMLYMSAQNELSGRAVENVGQIRRCVILEKICAYILLDKMKVLSSAEPDERYTTLYEVPPAATGADFDASMHDLGIDKEMTDPRVFERHLRRARDHFTESCGDSVPNQTILFLWGHGGGLVMLDEQQGAGVVRAQANIKDFAKALTRVATGDDPFAFGIVAFDSCYMAMIETMNQLRRSTQFALCSSTQVDANGFPYESIFRDMKAHGDTWTAAIAAQTIAKLYRDHYAEKYPDGSRFLFVCHLDKIGVVADWLNALGAWLASGIASGSDDDPVRAAASEALVGSGADPTYAPSLRFLRLLELSLAGRIPDDGMREAERLVGELRKAINESFPGGPADGAGSLISPIIWAPMHVGTYLATRRSYNALDASQNGAGGWATFWRIYHNRTELEDPLGPDIDLDVLGLPALIRSAV